MDVITHYDLLIAEGNDPVHDPPALKQYMDRWDGAAFIEAMQLSGEQTVLEIGVGTGRLAIQVAPLCGHLTGIDISPKTIERASENLAAYPDVRLICADFSDYDFGEKYDVVYSSLTSIHFRDKQHFLSKAASLLKPHGLFCLSMDQNPSNVINMGSRTLEIYPDHPREIIVGAERAGMKIIRRFDTEAAHILVCMSNDP